MIGWNMGRGEVKQEEVDEEEEEVVVVVVEQVEEEEKGQGQGWQHRLGPAHDELQSLAYAYHGCWQRTDAWKHGNPNLHHRTINLHDCTENRHYRTRDLHHRTMT